MGMIEKVVIVIVKEIGGKFYWIILVMVYILLDFDWNDKVSCSLVEMIDEKLCFVLGGEMIDLKDYDVVFFGYLLWWDLCLCLVNIFFEKYDFVGKVVIFFVILGGSLIMGSVK